MSLFRPQIVCAASKNIRKQFRTLLLESLDRRDLMAVDFLVPQVANLVEIAGAPSESKSAESTDNALGLLAEHSRNLASTIAPQSVLGQQGSSPSELAQLASKINEPDSQSSSKIMGAAWTDFERRVSKFVAPESVPALEYLQQIGKQPTKLQNQLIGSSFAQRPQPGNQLDFEPLPSVTASVDLLRSNGSITSILQAQAEQSGGEDLNPHERVRAATLSVGWFCNVDGSSSSGFVESIPAEGEDPDAGGDEPPLDIPKITLPPLEANSGFGDFDTYAPSFSTSGSSIETRGSFSEYTTADSDLTVPGLNYVHTVTRNWIDATHWSLTEQLVMGFNLSESLSVPLEELPQEGNGTGDDAEAEHSIQKSLNATLKVVRSGFVILQFHAEQGMSIAADLGVVWSLNLSFSDSIGVSLSLGGSQSISPLANQQYTGIENTPASGSNTEPSLPSDFQSSSSWNFSAGVNVRMAGSLVISSTPVVVAPATTGSAGMNQREYGYSDNLNAKVSLAFGGDWNTQSESGNLDSPSPVSEPTEAPSEVSDFFGGTDSGRNSGTTGAFDEVPSDGVLPVDTEDVRNSWEDNPDDWLPMSMPQGVGHKFGNSGQFASSASSGSHNGLNFQARVAPSGELADLSGALRAGFDNQFGDNFADNQILEFATGEGNKYNGWFGVIMAGRNVKPNVLAGVGNNKVFNLSSSTADGIALAPTGDTQYASASGGDGGLTFEHILIEARTTVPTSHGGY